MKKEGIKHYSKEKLEELSAFSRLMFNRPILKFVILVIIFIGLSIIKDNFQENLQIKIIIYIIEALIALYFVLIITFLIKHGIDRLFNPKNIFSWVLTYALFLLGIILLFSTVYSVTELSGLGYIKYGTCSNQFNSGMILSDPQITGEYIYFSAITFFAVGYGDICPMGFAKIIAIINAFVGHLVAVVIVALIINNYLKRKEKEPS